MSLDMAISHATSYSPTDNAHVEVFHKTLGFYCALVEKGCAFSLVADFPDSSDTIEQENNPPGDAEGVDDELPRSNCKRKARMCIGELELKHDDYNQPYIQYISLFSLFSLCYMLMVHI